VNIASAQSTPANSPLSSALAPFTSSSDTASSQPAAPPSNFVSLLAAFVEQTVAAAAQTPGFKGASQTRTNKTKDDKQGNDKQGNDKQGNNDQLPSLPSQLSVSQTPFGLPLNAAAWQANGSRSDTQATDSKDTSSPSRADSASSSAPISLDASLAAGGAPLAFALQVKEAAPQGQVEDLPGASPRQALNASSRQDMPANSMESEYMNADGHTSADSSPQHQDGNMRTTSASRETGSTDGDAKLESSPAAKPAADGSQTRPAAARTAADVAQQTGDGPQKTVRARQSAALEDDPAKQESPAAPEAGFNAAAVFARVNTNPNPAGVASASADSGSRSLRPQSPEIPDAGPALTPPAAKEISMRLSAEDSQPVDIKLLDQGGTLRVAVRTPDTDLARNLQSGLSDLVQRLEHKGFETETWSPMGNSGAQVEKNAQANNEDSNSQRNSRDPRDGAQQGNGGQQNQGRNRPKWVAELEQKLGIGATE
jgi:hypothetical protein